jgi:hypothetical protein
MGYARSLFLLAHRYAAEYMSGVAERTVTPSAEAVEALRNFDEPMPDGPAAPLATLEKLHRFGSPATIAQTGGRYFGFVNGGVIPEALASRWLIDAWDQNTALEVMSPVGSRLEHVCEQWLVDLLGLPKEKLGARAQAAGAWMHVDGVFGLWAAASRNTRHLTDGVELVSICSHATTEGDIDRSVEAFVAARRRVAGSS